MTSGTPVHAGFRVSGVGPSFTAGNRAPTGDKARLFVGRALLPAVNDGPTPLTRKAP